MINSDVKTGKDVVIYHPELVNLYGCIIGDGCKIGAFVEIRKDVVIGKNVKIQAFAFIPEGITIEDNVFIGPHVCFTNDRYPRATKQNGMLLEEGDWRLERTIIKEGASIGANATILCGVTIGKNSIIGAGAVVTKDVQQYTIVAGNPAKFLNYCNSGS